MKYVLSFLVVCATISIFAVDANAVVCARGVYRAGCVGPNGAVVVNHCRWVRGVRVC